MSEPTSVTSGAPLDATINAPYCGSLCRRVSVAPLVALVSRLSIMSNASFSSPFCVFLSAL